MAIDNSDGGFLDFLKFALQPATEPPPCVGTIDWQQLLAFAERQNIVGLCWEGVRRLTDAAHKPTDDDVLDWMSRVVALEKTAGQANEISVWASEKFRAEGFDTCILKGQGAALLYPNPLMRAPGDVDIWVRPRGTDFRQADKAVISYVRRIRPKAKACYHHIDFIRKNDIPIEVHYRPQWMNRPLSDRRLQEFFAQEADRQFANSVDLPFNAGSVSVPTLRFNAVFLLAHLQNHLLHEGIGLRHVVDYYYLLRHLSRKEESTDWDSLLHHLGLRATARGLMWLLHHVLGLEEAYLIVQPDGRMGRMLLGEMLSGGNFGRYDARLMSGTYSSAPARNLQRVVRDLRLMRYLSSECLWEPWFRLWHWRWRSKNKG